MDKFPSENLEIIPLDCRIMLRLEQQRRIGGATETRHRGMQPDRPGAGLGSQEVETADEGLVQKNARVTPRHLGTRSNPGITHTCFRVSRSRQDLCSDGAPAPLEPPC